MGVFSDVSDTDANRRFIEAMYFSGVTRGNGGSTPYVDLTYGPALNTLNGELAAFIVTGLKVNLEPTVSPDSSPPALFSDVATTHQFYAVIQKLAKIGSIAGPERQASPADFGPGIFTPDSAVLRKQMMSFIVRARRWTLLNPAVATFTDVSPSHPYYKEIETGYAQGIIDPSGAGPTFSPNGTITRAAISSVITKAFNVPVPP